MSDRINIVNSGSRFEGRIEFNDYTRFEGTLNGELVGKPGSVIIIGNNGIIEGSISAEVITIDGYVRGEITATRKVVVSGTGRVIGDIKAPSIEIQFGGFFEGNCQMENQLPAKNA